MKTRTEIIKDRQYFKFCLYGFLKNLRFFEPFLIIFFLQKDLSYLEIGTLYAIREIAINIFEIPSGIVADALGRRLTLAYSLLIYIVAFVIFYLSQSYLLFAFAMLFYALGDAFRSGIHKALIVSYLKKTGQSDLRVSYYGHTRSWSQLGSALSSLLAGIMVFFNENLNVIFLFSVVPYLFGFMNILTYPKNLDEQNKGETQIKRQVVETLRSFLNAMKNLRLLRILINASIYSGFYKSAKDFIQPFLKVSLASITVLAFATEHQQLSIFLGVSYFLMFLGSAFASRNAEKAEKLVKTRANFLNFTLIGGATAGLATGLLIMEWVVPAIVIMLFIILLVIENLRKPSAVAEITIAGKSEVHASVLSVLSQLTSVFASIFVIMIGYLADQFSLGSGIAVVSVIILIVSLVLKVKDVQ